MVAFIKLLYQLKLFRFTFNGYTPVAFFPLRNERIPKLWVSILFVKKFKTKNKKKYFDTVVIANVV